MQHERQHADRGHAARRRLRARSSSDRPVFASRRHSGPKRGPGQQARIVAQLIGAFERLPTAARIAGAPGSPSARDDQRHAAYERGAGRWTPVRVSAGRSGAARSRRQSHGSGIAGVAADAARLRRASRRPGPDRSARPVRRRPGGSPDPGNRAAPPGDVAAEVVDRDGQFRSGHVSAAPRRAAPRPLAKPGRARRRRRRRTAAGACRPSVGGQPRGPLERPATRPRRRCAGRRACRPARAPTDAASSGPIAAGARCQARRSTSRSGRAPARARCASRRRSAGASA